jgi:internalin A
MILDMSENKIVDLSPIAKKALMKNLILSGNEVVDVSPIGTLRVLKHLDLSRNKIEDLSPLLTFENSGMKVFTAEANPIIKDDAHCPKEGGAYLMRLFCRDYLK